MTNIYVKIRNDFDCHEYVELDDTYIQMLNVVGDSKNKGFEQSFARNIKSRGVISRKQALLLNKLYIEGRSYSAPCGDEHLDWDMGDYGNRY